nr:putative capsid protein [Crucivirus sp.]
MPRTAVAVRKRAKPKAKRAGASVRGHGDYGVSPSMRYGSTYSNPGPVGKAGRYLGRLAGQAVAGPIGGFLGEKAGGLAHYIGKIFGAGDYVASAGVKMNSITGGDFQPQALNFNSGKTSVRIRRREFLGDVISSATANTFQIKSYSINPGLAATFPWMSEVCGSTFQQYRINGMVFEFRSMSADALNSTNTALGSVVMATDYDSADVAFTSKQQMENSEFGVSCKPSSCMIHAIECAKGATSISEQYIRAFAIPTNTDIRVYDLGKFYIATTGCQGTSVNLGELWVSYDVTLIKAIDQVPGYIMPLANYVITGAVPASAPLGSSRAIASGGVDTIGLTFTANRIIFSKDYPVGSTFAWTYAYNMASGVVTPPTVTYATGLTNLALYSAPLGGETATRMVLSGFFQVTAMSTTDYYVNIANFTAGATTGCILDVYQVSGVPQAP